MPIHNPLAIAKESLAMSEKTGDKNFMRMAIGLMALTGLGTLFHALHEIYRDLKPRRENDKPERAYQPPRPEEYDEEPHRHQRGDSPEKSWVRKARVGERPAEGEKVWADHGSRRNHSRHH
jgi:hypothetical protein